ncbi:hypothetical protein C8R43DRAFT_207937 [Mycena crocata]|nr:hypothetical protein C8R43DRAFT_207937 [Mycena crocata]
MSLPDFVIALPPSLQTALRERMQSPLTTGRNNAEAPLLMKITPENVEALLPTLFAVLEAGNIPTPDVIEALGGQVDSVAIAFYVLTAIPTLRYVSTTVYVELWEHSWPWIDLMHTYRKHLLGLPSARELYGTFVSIFVQLQAHDCRQQVEGTPGVRVVVGAAWDIFLDGPKNDENAAHLRNVSFFIHWETQQVHNRDNIEEYMEGIGGGLDCLALTIVKHLGRAIEQGEGTLSGTGMSHFTAAIAFIHRLERMEEYAKRFDTALLRAGIVRVLTSGLSSLNCVAADYPNGLVLMLFSFGHLGMQVSTPPGRLSMSEALQSGLLRAVILAASNPICNQALMQQLQQHLTLVLPGYMVFRSLLTHIKSSLLDVDGLVEAPAFIASELYAPWQEFHALVRERLDFLESFNAAPSIMYKACDNMACSQIHVKSELQRCSTCLDLYYCSRQCQKSDWEAGHRDACNEICGLRRLPEEQQCSMQDRAFLRALVRRDYIANRTKVYTEVIKLLKQNSTQLYYVMFNYMSGPASVDVLPWPENVSEMVELPWDLLIRFHNHGARAVTSAGRVEVHVMVIPNGLKPHYKIFPIRHRSDVLSELREIVESTADISITDPAFEQAVEEKLSPLLNLDSHFNFIHE